MRLLDRDNLLAVLWGALYCFLLVVVAAACDRLGLTPLVTVPVVVLALPIALGLALAGLERSLLGKSDG
jgi:hypothetical protein